MFEEHNTGGLAAINRLITHKTHTWIREKFAAKVPFRAAHRAVPEQPATREPLQQSVIDGESNQLRPAPQGELGHHVLAVGFDSFGANPKTPGDVAVGAGKLPVPAE